MGSYISDKLCGATTCGPTQFVVYLGQQPASLQWCACHAVKAEWERGYTGAKVGHSNEHRRLGPILARQKPYSALFQTTLISSRTIHPATTFHKLGGYKYTLNNDKHTG